MVTRIAIGDAREKLRLLGSESINCCATSPPYWMKRDYGAGSQEIGKEPTIQEYIDNLLQVIDEVHRVLMPHGTFWLNLGDTYATQAGTSRGGTYYPETGTIRNVTNGDVLIKSEELPHKSQCLIPYRVVIAMSERGWIVRNVIIWHKPDCMPESVEDRFTVDYEPVFFCTKNPRYYFKQQLRPYSEKTLKRCAKYIENGTAPVAPAKILERISKNLMVPGRTTHSMHIDRANGDGQDVFDPAGANMRSVWKISTAGYRGAHFAVFPERLVEVCIDAGCPPGGTVIDPFLGAGTVAVVAERMGRDCVGIELNPEFARQARERILTARAKGLGVGNGGRAGHGLGTLSSNDSTKG
jgi:site-specific DNA-methyltransferase (adenine-specific)